MRIGSGFPSKVQERLPRFSTFRTIRPGIPPQPAVEALKEAEHLKEVIRDAPPEAVRKAFAGLVERITLFFDYGPRSNGLRPAIFTSFKVRMRPEAVGLLGDKLRRPARSTA
jgi:hypothetical protein